MPEPGERLMQVLTAGIALLHQGQTGPLADLLDEAVVWQGLRPELVCQNRTEVMGMLGRMAGRRLHITRLEAAEGGDAISIQVEGPDFEAFETAPAGLRSLRFQFRDGRIVRMESLAPAAPTVG